MRVGDIFYYSTARAHELGQLPAQRAASWSSWSWLLGRSWIDDTLFVNLRLDEQNFAIELLSTGRSPEETGLDVTLECVTPDPIDFFDTSIKHDQDGFYTAFLFYDLHGLSTRLFSPLPAGAAFGACAAAAAFDSVAAGFGATGAGAGAGAGLGAAAAALAAKLAGAGAAATGSAAAGGAALTASAALAGPPTAGGATLLTAGPPKAALWLFGGGN